MPDVTPKGRGTVTGAEDAKGTGADVAAGGDGRGSSPSPSPSSPSISPSPASKAPQESRTPPSLLPRDECDKLTARLEHAVVGFVDGPRDAVEEADHVLEELAARLTDVVQRRRRTLRGSWRPAGPGDGEPAADTEQLRLALRDYRELSERLLRM
ncbi:hypothetical protein JCM4814A_63800 [Streptomyces phaeofaciens JCM 4814]|uniref:Uncharacterized protein n=1 Tax=Streptomyces phaeofaciens TaxID=68254 RepID=A0A918LYM5_9ACTN|nr:hypothetical protein [Streptomyces phaeofaciens]GGT77082.1 hypothetical protein GCM10010226_64140 [Streptomyces phaeofaciens]